MAIENLLDFANAQLETETQALTTARTALMTAAEKVRLADAEVTKLGMEITNEANVGSAIERRLAVEKESTKKDEIIRELSDHEIRMLRLEAQATRAQQTAAVAASTLTHATAETARAERAVKDTTQSVAEAKQRADEWKKTIADVVEELRTRNPVFAASVQELLDSDADAQGRPTYAYLAAKKRVEAEVPKALRDEARKRIKDIRDDIDDATADEETAATAAAQKRGFVPAAWLAVERAERRMRALVNAERALDDAKAQLTEINKAQRMGESLQKKIDAMDKTVKDALKAVSDAKKDVDAKQKKVTDKEEERDNAPDDATRDLRIAELEPLNKELENAQKELVKANEAHARAADLWRNAVPEDAWRRLLLFDDITGRLNDLKKLTAVEIQAIRDAYAAAEKALAVALNTEADARRATDKAIRTLAERREEANAGREIGHARVLVALRTNA